MTSIGGGAFLRFRGTLTITGSFPLLSTIGYEAFFISEGNTDSTIELVGADQRRRRDLMRKRHADIDGGAHNTRMTDTFWVPALECTCGGYV